MDIYSEIRSENTTKLIETPFGGRFCGPIPPRRRVSLYQGIALSFFTDKNVTLPNIFSGIYKFINACKCPVSNDQFLIAHTYFPCRVAGRKEGASKIYNLSRRTICQQPNEGGET